MRWPIQIATVTADLHRGKCDCRNVNAKKTCINCIKLYKLYKMWV